MTSMKAGHFGLALFVLSAALFAQTPVVQRVMPDAASPGDLVILEGTNMQTTTAVRFSATVGGFVGVLNVNVTPISVSATRVEVLCPTINAFAPPTAFPPGGAAGTVRAVAGATTSGTLSFTFYEATFGQFQTTGQGSLQSTGQGRPVVSWPLVGSQAVVSIHCENAIPFSFAYLAISLPATAPYTTINGAPLIVSVPPAVLFEAIPVDANGKATVQVNAVSGGPFNITLALQWAVLDFTAQNVALSNALLVQF